MKVQVKFKMQAHISSGVVMDIAAFKVSHSSRIDIDATALRAPRAGSSTTGRWRRVQGRFNRWAHVVSLILVHGGVGQRCRALDVESPALQSKSKRSA